MAPDPSPHPDPNNHPTSTPDSGLELDSRTYHNSDPDSNRGENLGSNPPPTTLVPNTNSPPSPHPQPDPNPNKGINTGPGSDSTSGPYLDPDPSPIPVLNPNPDSNSVLTPNPCESTSLHPGEVVGWKGCGGKEVTIQAQFLAEENSRELKTNQSDLFQVNFDLGTLETSAEDSDSGHEEETHGSREETGKNLGSNIVVFGVDSINSSPSPIPESGPGHPPVFTGTGLGGATHRTSEGELNEAEVRKESNITQSSSHKPTRHPGGTFPKNQWTLTVERPVLILGDSNLSRIQTYQQVSVQVDSYPGAIINHLTAILKKLEPCNRTLKVVLSVGLNNCNSNNLQQTIQKQFRILVNQAKRTFPCAEIFIPLIQISPRLPISVQNLAKETNQFLEKTFAVLKGVEETLFRTEPHDPVHWTAKTADLILKSWISQLNIKQLN